MGYHTQEYRANAPLLDKPIRCKGKNAWLGVGYYFWTELEFAHYWGQDFKVSTGYYDISRVSIDVENCLNTVFDEDCYFFFRKKIEETIDIFKNRNLTVSLEQVHRFLTDNVWTKHGIEGIIYDDKPTNPRKSDRIYSEIPDLYYKKRIQVMIFSLKNIRNFEIYLEEQN